MPKKIEFSGEQSEINYRYDPTGNKLEKRVSGSGISETTTQYAGNYIYKNNDLQFFNTSEGYASPKSDGNFEYIYQYKDHLGNVRLSYTENHDIDIPETVFYDNATNTQGWDSNGPSYGVSAPVATDKSFSGGKSFKIHSTSGSRYAHSNQRIAINNSEPTEYTFSGRIFVESAGYANGRIILFMDDEDGNSTEIASGDKIKIKGQWVYYEKTVIVPAYIDKMNLRIGLYHETNNSTAWFDDLKIVKGNLSRTTIVEESNYYPFGLQHKGYNNVVNGTENKYKTFQGQELEEELGKNTLAYQWRDYDPAIGRFNKIDRFAEKYANLTPYHFASNNPIRFVEVAGDSLKIDGSKKGVKAFNKTVNNNLGGLYDVNRNGDTGQVTVTRNGKKGKLTKSQSKFLGTLNKVIGDKKTTSFKVLAKGEKGTKNFPIGDNGLRSDGLATEPGVHLIDMGDVNAFPNIGGGIISNAGMLSHELQEGFDIQVGGKTPLSAHKAGFATQAGIDGIRITAGASINATGTQMSIPVIRRGAGNKPVSATIKAQLKNNDIIKIINNEN